MEPLTMSESAMGEQFHDCNSQPCSPVPNATAENGVEGKMDAGDPSPVASREPTPALSGDSSKENSPRPETVPVAPKKDSQSVIDKKLKKREDKNMDYVLKALSSLSTPEEKLAALCKKYTDLLDENRQHASAVKSSSKKLSVASRDRDSLQTENSKLILAKSKLESLCRELQRHNKVIKEESMARQREEEERRKEVSGRFQTTIGDIQTQMEAHSKRNDKLQEDNKELSSKLGTLLEQYEQREEHIQKLLHQKDLETKLLEAKLEQCQMVIEKEQEKGGAEKQMLLEKLIESKSAQEAMAQTEVHLKTQLNIYTQKYTEFETTLNKSNEVFAAFKSEMEKMSKKIKKLEKESLMYKQRWENTNRALLEMVEQKTQQEKRYELQGKKNKQLESLCRALQQRAAGETTSPAPTDNGAEATETNQSSTEYNDSQSSDKKSLGPDNSVRPQAIGQSSDEQETGSEAEKTDGGSTADADSVAEELTATGETSGSPEDNSTLINSQSGDEETKPTLLANQAIEDNQSTNQNQTEELGDEQNQAISSANQQVE